MHWDQFWTEILLLYSLAEWICTLDSGREIDNQRENAAHPPQLAETRTPDTACLPESHEELGHSRDSRQRRYL